MNVRVRSRVGSCVMVKQDRDARRECRDEDWASVAVGECARSASRTLDSILRIPIHRSSLVHIPHDPIRLLPNFHHSPLTCHRHSVTPDLGPGCPTPVLQKPSRPPPSKPERPASNCVEPTNVSQWC